MLKAVGVFECIDDFVLFEGRLEHKLLENEIKKYEKMGISTSPIFSCLKFYFREIRDGHSQ